MCDVEVITDCPLDWGLVCSINFNLSMGDYFYKHSIFKRKVISSVAAVS